MFRLGLLTALLLLASASAYADNCDAIRRQIDAKVRTSGVTNFSLSVVDSNAKVNGKVVGTCDLGTKKVVYTKADSSPASRPGSSPKEAAIITECRDGTVTRGGDCGK